jgi:zinc protease
VGVGALSRSADAALDVLADVARNPRFDADEIARVREQRLASLMQRRAHPSAMAYDAFCRACYPGHPYGEPVEGTEAAVARMDEAAMRGFHARAFAPDNLLIVAVGDVHPDQLLPRIEALFGDLHPAGHTPASAPPPALPDGPMVCIADKPDAVQSSILVGHAGIARRDPDFIAVYLLNMILGGYFGSRLNLLLREEKGHTYGAHSRFEARMQAGPFTAGADVRTEVTAEAVADTIREIARLTDEEVGAEELARVQRYVTGSFPIQIETPAQVAQRIVTIELYGLGKGYYNTYNSRVLALTPADILAAARRHVHPGRLVIGVSGDAATLREQLAPFGAVRISGSDRADPIPASSSNGNPI